ncbi:MAG: hypothetical protein V3R98_03060 [Alphaproteobacteria bacterium]
MIRRAMLAALLLVAAMPATAAEDLPLGAFFGTWQGHGVAENADSLYFAITTRDLDVVIKPDGDGFEITWTTVIRSGGDPNDPDVRRREATLEFRATDRPAVFEAESSGNPLEGDVLSWARITENTLTVYQMVLNDGGGYDLTSYDRTISDLGMELVFRRLRDGDAVRSVTGRLIKTAD